MGDRHECEWYFDGTFVHEGSYCPNCGAVVIADES